MIEKEFWEDVRNAWILKAPPQIRDTKTSSGGEIDPDLLQDPWDVDGIPFDMLDFDQAVEAGLTGKKFEVSGTNVNGFIVTVYKNEDSVPVVSSTTASSSTSATETTETTTTILQ